MLGLGSLVWLPFPGAAKTPKGPQHLVVPSVAGGELFERIVDDDFEHTEPSSAQYVQQILEGLQFMHSQAIVHLDLKPENIVCVSPSSHWIKIIDFGLARKLGELEALECPGQALLLVTVSGTGSGPWGTKPGPDNPRMLWGKPCAPSPAAEAPVGVWHTEML